MLAMAAPAEEVSCGRVPVWQCKSNSQVESACYLFAPAKDAQAGGHRLKLASWQTSLIHLTLGRLRPDWVEGGRPLSIPHKSITVALPHHRFKEHDDRHESTSLKLRRLRC